MQDIHGKDLDKTIGINIQYENLYIFSEMQQASGF